MANAQKMQNALTKDKINLTMINFIPLSKIYISPTTASETLMMWSPTFSKA